MFFSLYNRTTLILLVLDLLLYSLLQGNRAQQRLLNLVHHLRRSQRFGGKLVNANIDKSNESRASRYVL
jgi:hypothetical protein